MTKSLVANSIKRSGASAVKLQKVKPEHQKGWLWYLNLPSFSYDFHRRPMTLNQSISSSVASGNKYP
jgi:hypothetical protein